MVYQRFNGAYNENIPGWLTPEDAAGLDFIYWEVIHDNYKGPDGDIVEIGVFAGRTTHLLASMMEILGCHRHIYAIDPWYKSDPPYEHTGLAPCTRDNWTTNDVQQIFRDEVVSKFDFVTEVNNAFPLTLDEIPFRRYDKKVAWVHWDGDSCTVDKKQFRHELEAGLDLIGNNRGVLSGHSFAHWMPNCVEVVMQLANDLGCQVILPGGSIWYLSTDFLR